MHGSAGTQRAAPIAHQFSVTRMRMPVPPDVRSSGAGGARTTVTWGADEKSNENRETVWAPAE
ncbi:hypothetical protein YT1_0634 [Rhodococcus ruber]|nr:hypothetical protein YT1_0634 [Rhodococcus ruber]